MKAVTSLPKQVLLPIFTISGRRFVRLGGHLGLSRL